MNNENSKTNQPNKVVYQFTDKLDLKYPLVNLSIYYKQKNIKSAYSNNRFKILAPTWNDEFDFRYSRLF